MKKNTDDFLAALSFLLAKKGHGSQKELANSIGIDPSFLNNIIKTRVPCPHSKKIAIAQYFKLEYDELTSLGHQLLNLFQVRKFSNIKQMLNEILTWVGEPEIQFSAAISFFLDDMSNDDLEKFSKDIDIGISILSAIKEEKACLFLNQDEKREIAKKFRLSLDEMFLLGENLLMGKSGKRWLNSLLENKRKYSDIDVNLLTLIISSTEKFIIKHNSSISPERKAKIIAFIYDDIYKSGKINNKEIVQKVHKLIQVVM